jgi:hypothetical protein
VDEIALDVVFRDLGRRFPDAQFRAKIDAQLIGGLPRLGKILNVDNPPDADVDTFELGVGKRVQVRQSLRRNMTRFGGEAPDEAGFTMAEAARDLIGPRP